MTARFQIAHGVALGIVLPHVVRWNAQTSADLYRGLISNSENLKETATNIDSGLQLANRLVNIGNACGFPGRLRDMGILKNDLEALASAAAEQWTGTFNPRPFGTSEALEMYGMRLLGIFVRNRPSHPIQVVAQVHGLGNIQPSDNRQQVHTATSSLPSEDSVRGAPNTPCVNCDQFVAGVQFSVTSSRSD